MSLRCAKNSSSFHRRHHRRRSHNITKMRDERKFIKSFPLLLNFIEAVKTENGREMKKKKTVEKRTTKLTSSSSSCVSFDNYTA